jgi:hypothetical protein
MRALTETPLIIKKWNPSTTFARLRRIPSDTENRIKINFYPAQNGSDASMVQQSLWKYSYILN